MVGSLFPSLTSRCSGLFEVKKETLKENDILLFQGDSITDAFRVRDNFAANHQRALGVGFVHNLASFLLGKYPEKKLKNI
ncbi:hypothetical protein DET52_101715 [Sunxiuqinia elliptica]|uniref:Uncharacterized protein n=2 Tax=Sunxiuqinia elliptica TaxID=655355 RepID=A0A4R6HBH2_9BACT|nr:hypothetical protein DET52_101715 [Sunxiuqinia elliptica]